MRIFLLSGLAVFTAVAAARPAWAGVGLLMLFGIRSLYLLVLVYGLLIWCRLRIAKSIRRFCRTLVTWVQWIQKKLRVVRYVFNVVTSTLKFLGALTALKSALALRNAQIGGELTALKAWKDFLGAGSSLFKSIWKLAFGCWLLVFCTLGLG